MFEGTNEARTRQKEVSSSCNSKDRTTIESNHPAVFAPYRHARGSLDPLQDIPFYFTVRYLRSYAPSSSLFLSTLLSLLGVVYKLLRASYTILDNRLSRYAKGKTARRSTKESHHRLASRYSILSGECKSYRERQTQPLDSASIVAAVAACRHRIRIPRKIGDAEIGSGVPTVRYPILFQSKRVEPVPLSARFVHPLRGSALTRLDDGFYSSAVRGLKGDIVPSLEMYRFIKFRRRKIFRITVSQRRIFRVKFTVEEFSDIRLFRQKNFQLEFYDERDQI